MSDALREAVRNGDGAAVEALLDAGTLVQGATAGGISAVLLALYSGHPDIASLFVKRGVVLTFPEACAIGDEPLATRLLDDDPALLDQRSDDGFPSLSLAIFFRHPALAAALIARGAAVNAVAANPQRVAPIHAAAAVSDHDTMELLLEQGADPDARQQLDYTPLLAAASRGDLKMGRLLITYGADPHLRSSDGKSPADLARDGGHDEFARWVEGLT